MVEENEAGNVLPLIANELNGMRYDFQMRLRMSLV